MMNASCEGVLMKNLEECMQQEVVTSPMTIGAPCNTDLSTEDGCAVTPLNGKPKQEPHAWHHINKSMLA